MSNDITVKIDGNPYRLSPLDARQTQEFLDYTKSAMPDPIQEVLDSAAMLPESMREAFIAKHLDSAFDRKKKRGTVTDPDVQEFIKTPAGYKKVFSLMFRKHHPHLSDDECVELVMKAIEEHGDTLFAKLYTTGNKVPLSEEDAERRFFRKPRTGSAKS